MDSSYLYKIVLIGDWGVGKTNILSQYTRNEFVLGSVGTIGVQFSTKSLVINNENVKVQVWDTAGQDKYRAITSNYYRGAHGALLVYDITRLDTFKRCDVWLKELKDFVKHDCVVVLIGNKSDLAELAEVKTENALAYAKELDIAFFETSALKAINIQQAFDAAILKIHSMGISQGFGEVERKGDFNAGTRKLEERKEEVKKKNCCT
jgi:Ras-related protein Rab-11A